MPARTNTSDGRPSVSACAMASQRASMNSERAIRKSGTSKERRKIQLPKSEQMMLGMVWLRALDAQSPRPILEDRYSQAILDQCVVDTKQMSFFTNSSGVTDPRAIRYVANRGLRLDQWTQTFLDDYEQRGEPVTILNLGCALDCRNLRIKRGDDARWIDLDRARSVNLRERVLDPPPADYSLRTLDITHKGWLKDIPSDRPTLIIAEGVFPYIEADVVRRIIHDIVEYFEEGEIIFDVMGQLLVKYTDFNRFIRSNKSVFKWGVDDAHTIETFHPRLKLKDHMFRKEFMNGVLPVFGRVGNMLCAMHPADKYNGQLLRFEFKREQRK